MLRVNYLYNDIFEEGEQSLGILSLTEFKQYLIEYQDHSTISFGELAETEFLDTLDSESEKFKTVNAELYRGTAIHFEELPKIVVRGKVYFRRHFKSFTSNIDEAKIFANKNQQENHSDSPWDDYIRVIFILEKKARQDDFKSIHVGHYTGDNFENEWLVLTDRSFDITEVKKINADLYYIYLK